MASQGKKGKKTKGKTLDLQSFLNAGPQANDGAAVVKIRSASSWADQMDEYDDRPSGPVQTVILPTAPLAARGPDISEDRIPRSPPFKIYLGNLSYDSNEDDVENFFIKLKVKSVRLIRETESEQGRHKGYGYVEFDDQASLIEALSMSECSLNNRKVKVDLASDLRSGGGSYNMMGDRGGSRGGRYDSRDDGGEDRTVGDWRSGPRETPPANDRYDSRGGGRDDDRGYNNRSQGHYNGSFDRSDGQRGGGGYGGSRDYGRREGFDRDRGGGGGGGFESGGYGGGRGFERRDDGFERRDRGGFGADRREGSHDEARQRPKLNLAKRSTAGDDKPAAAAPSSIFGGAKPVDTARKEKEIVEKIKNTTISAPAEKPKSTDIFGAAKPVDTAAREREIEARLLKEREESSGKDKPSFEKGQRDEHEDEKSSGGRRVIHLNRDRDSGDQGGSRYQPPQHRDRNHDREAPRDREAPQTRNDRGDRDAARDQGDRNARDGSAHRDRDGGRTPDDEPAPVLKLDETKPPNFVGSNKFSFLDDEEDVGSQEPE